MAEPAVTTPLESTVLPKSGDPTAQVTGPGGGGAMVPVAVLLPSASISGGANLIEPSPPPLPPPLGPPLLPPPLLGPFRWTMPQPMECPTGATVTPAGHRRSQGPTGSARGVGAAAWRAGSAVAVGASAGVTAGPVRQ
jgi:hypothetical protein